MLTEAVAHARFTLSLIFGIPFDMGSLERLADALRQTRHEFGQSSLEAAELLRGPALDDETLSRRPAPPLPDPGRPRRTRDGVLWPPLRPARPRPGPPVVRDIARIPPTPKEAVRDDPGRLRAAGRSPVTAGRDDGHDRHADRDLLLARRDAVVHGARGDLAALRWPDRPGRHRADQHQRPRHARQLASQVPASWPARWFTMPGWSAPSTPLATHRASAARWPARDRVSLLMTYPSHLGEVVEHGLQLGLGPTISACDGSSLAASW